MTLYICTEFIMPYILKMKKFTIGQLAKETGITAETIRFYEKYGLIEKPGRRKSGYREFTQKHIGQVAFIKQTKTMGFTLKEILTLLDYVGKKQSKSDIRKFMEARILSIEAHISNLKKTKQSIQLMLKECLTRKSIYDCTLFKPLKS